VVPAITVAGWAHDDQGNRDQRSALTCRARQHSGWLGPGQPSEQRPDQRSQLLCPPTQWMAELKLIKRSKARAAPSPVVPVNTVAGWTHAEQAIRGQSIALNCRARHHSGWLIPRRPSRQRPDLRLHPSCLPPQWLAEATSTNRTEATSAPLPVVPATTAAGWSHADQANRGQNSALICRAPDHSGWMSPRRAS
jgi:hypothetical protein